MKSFIHNIIGADLSSGRYNKIVTRFPPEPNGYLHIGHAKSICLNFGLVTDNFPGNCNMRLDDTNPETEKPEYVKAILNDVNWLGYNINGSVKFTSDYFNTIHAYAMQLIKDNKAYVCDLLSEDMKLYRGTLTESGKNSPYRDRTIEENLSLFEQMTSGNFSDGSKTLRLKIDMSSPNMNMRDPVIYRIKNISHYNCSEYWNVYPMYDFAHCISDAIEGITHSLCTLEFEDHRPLYEWILDNIHIDSRPKQYEFSRLELSHTVTSKRKLNELVMHNHVNGWDDPRMPTIAGLRRRGYTPESIHSFIDQIGVSKSDNFVNMSVLENALRNDLENKTKRVLAVINPLKITLTNYSDLAMNRNAPYHPSLDYGEREIKLSSEIWIEREDFSENPPPGWQRLAPGKEVRLRYSYIIKCNEVVYDTNNNVSELRCTIDYNTLGKNPIDRKVKGVIHFVSVEHSIPIEIRMYNRLFNIERPTADKDVNFINYLNPNSLIKKTGYIENHNDFTIGSKYQFERLGYFCVDNDSSKSNLVFNLSVSLKDNFKN